MPIASHPNIITHRKRQDAAFLAPSSDINRLLKESPHGEPGRDERGSMGDVESPFSPFATDVLPMLPLDYL